MSFSTATSHATIQSDTSCPVELWYVVITCAYCHRAAAPRAPIFARAAGRRRRLERQRCIVIRQVCLLISCCCAAMQTSTHSRWQRDMSRLCFAAALDTLETWHIHNRMWVASKPAAQGTGHKDSMLWCRRAARFVPYYHTPHLGPPVHPVALCALRCLALHAFPCFDENLRSASPVIMCSLLQDAYAERYATPHEPIIVR